MFRFCISVSKDRQDSCWHHNFNSEEVFNYSKIKETLKLYAKGKKNKKKRTIVMQEQEESNYIFQNKIG